MNRRKEIGILGVNVIYLLTGILLLTVGSYYQHKDLKSGLIITEYILVLLPPLIYTKIKGDSLKRVLKLKKLRVKHGILVVFITILSYPIALFFNLVIMSLLSWIGKLEQPPIPTANNVTEYIVLMGIIAVSAGICEEVFFRGLVMGGYERLGKVQAVIISALLFGLFHFNIENFAGPVVLGLIFGYLVQRTNSIFAGIIGHITNNGIAVTLGFMTNLSNNKMMGQNALQVQQMPDAFQMILSTLFIGVVATVTGLMAYFLLRTIMNETLDYECIDWMESDYYEMEVQKPSVITFVPIFLTIILFIYVGYNQIMGIMY